MKNMLIIICILLLCLTIVGCKEVITETKYELKSFIIDNDISGHYFLLCGSFNSNIHYYTYIKDGNNCITFRKINYSNIEIYEDLKETENPYVIYYEVIKYSLDPNIYKWKFHIPQNSIKNIMNVDLEKK